MAGIDQYSKLLLSFDGLDGSKSHPLTCTGNAKLSTAQKKFGVSSLLCDGTGDYISVPDSDEFYLATSAFTIEAWIRHASTNYNAKLWSQTQGDNTIFIDLDYRDTQKKIYFGNYTTGGGYTTLFSCPYDPTSSTWHHVAIVRIDADNDADAWRFFVDGVSQTLTKYSTNWNASLDNFAANLFIGNQLNGYMDEFRFSKGIARWTSNFTPPTSKYKSDTYTALLLHFDGANNATATEDSSGGDEAGSDRVEKITTYVGTAQLDTAQSKFGGSSLLLDGNSDYITVPDSDDWFILNGDFTIDFWVRFNSVAASQGICGQFVDVSGPSYFWQITWAQNTKQLKLYGGFVSGGYKDTHFYTTWEPSANTWYHVAMERDGNSARIFVNGTALSTELDGWENFINHAAVLDIGYTRDAGLYLNGWLDEFRFSKGIARWTSNFTPPTEAYTEQADVTVTPAAQELESSVVTAPASPWVQIISKPATLAQTLTIESPKIIIASLPSLLELDLTQEDSGVNTTHFPGTQELDAEILMPVLNALVLPDVLDVQSDPLAPGVGTSPLAELVALTGAVIAPIPAILAQPRSIAGPFQLGVYAGFNPRVGSLAPLILRYIKDPVVIGGCPQCGTMLYNEGEPIASDDVAFGRNASTSSDDVYVRCARCKFPVKISRHSHAARGSRVGWGMRYDETQAGS